MEHVEAIDHQRQTGFGQSLRQPGVPYHVIGVGTVVVISSAAVDGQVGGELKLPGQGSLEGRTIVKIPHTLCLKAFSIAGGAVEEYVAVKSQTQPREFILEL